MKIEIAQRASFPMVSKRIVAIQEMFGIGSSPQKVEIVKGLDLVIGKGEIAFVTGPSGCGKSSILRFIKRNVEGALDISETIFDKGSSLIDSLDCSFQRALEILSLVGLGEAFLMLRCFDELSEGQKSRFRLAYALSKEPSLLIADEFCSTLDRLTAKVVSYNLRRVVNKTKKSAVVATANDDILSDLHPDLLVYPKGGGEWIVERKEKKPGKLISFYSRLRVREGRLSDWKRFAHFHYKSHSTGIVDKIFILTLDGEPIGVVVYAYPMGDLKLRNIVTGGRYSGSGLTRGVRKHLLNDEVRVVQRIVIDPRFRGLGLASALLRSTMPLLSVRLIECLAVMGGYSKFLEKAGFVCVGRVSLPKEGRLLLGELNALGYGAERLHDEEALCEILEEKSAESAVFEELLRRWLKVRLCNRRKGSDKKANAREMNFRKAAHLLCRELLSRPFYFICDVRESCKEVLDDSGRTPVIPFEGEPLEPEQNG
ncbi:MAG: ATP-binding cassette domain-containing protein [Planctomycetota bacterium]|nr:ATP-binding cassette domain-containing protein [Planctomycetota bacterium]